jgi:hypothetical protein
LREWRVVGRRGGVGGISDRLRRHLAGAVAAGLGAERRAVLVSIVLGEDEGLSEELQRSFKASGLYHLLSADQEARTRLALAVRSPDPRRTLQTHMTSSSTRARESRRFSPAH